MLVRPAGRPAGRTAARRAISPGRLLGAALEWVGIALTLVFIGLPIVWIALTAFKSEGDAYTLNVLFVPTLDNFIAIFGEPLYVGRLIVNSVVVAVATVLIAIPLALMAAYVFSRHVFVGSSVLLVWVLSTQFIPPVVVTIPFFQLFRELGLIDTRQALVILNLAVVLPYAIWMLKGFVDALPPEVEEAAFVDGCGELGILRHVTFPLVMPGVLVTAVFSFIAAWNEFLFALIMTRTDARTIQIGLLNAAGLRGVQWEWMSAVGILVMVPIFILSLLIRRHFVQGLTLGAAK